MDVLSDVFVSAGHTSTSLYGQVCNGAVLTYCRRKLLCKTAGAAGDAAAAAAAAIYPTGDLLRAR